MARWLMLLVLALGFSSAQEFAVYRSPKYGFSISYPKTWRAIDDPTRKAVHVIDQSSPNLIKPSFFITTLDVPARLDLANADAVVQDALETLLTDYSLALKQSGTLGGLPAVQLLYTARQGKFTLAGFTTYTLRGGKLYLVVFGVERREYEQYQNIGGTILGSFRFL